jgi:D-amino-acid oxidase
MEGRRSERRAVVVGAGVSGLTTAIRLQEAGWQVETVAAEPAEKVVSSVAAAIWYPYKALPQDKVTPWAKRTLEVLEELASRHTPGIYLRRGLDLFLEETEAPWWRPAVRRLDPCPPHELPPGFASGWRLEVPVVEMPLYLRWLRDRFEKAGGRIELRRLDALEEAGPADLIVNCTGLGARELADDDTLVPVKGQVVKVRNPGLTDFVLDEYSPEGPAYVIPRSHDCVLGGTADEGVWDDEPDLEVAQLILERCLRLEPRLQDAEVIEHRAGLRPVRPEVRIERTTLPDGTTCIHNYGHGGAGVTLSWGCAGEVVALAEG